MSDAAKTFRRWLTKPVVSAADVLAGVLLAVAAAVVAHYTHWPLPAVWALLGGGCALAAFGVGFVRGFGRSVLQDWRAWRARP